MACRRAGRLRWQLGTKYWTQLPSHGKRGLTDYFDGDPAVALRLDRFQGAADRVHGNVRETPGRISRFRPVREVSAASGSGVPHHGGSIAAPAEPITATGAANASESRMLPTPLLVVTWKALLREVEQGTPKRPKSYMPVPPPYVDRCRFRPSPPAEWSRIYAGTIGQVKDCLWPVPFSVTRRANSGGMPVGGNVRK